MSSLLMTKDCNWSLGECFVVFFSDCVLVFCPQIIFLLKLSIFYVLLLCINNIRVVMGIVHMVDMVIWVLKADWVQFWLMESNSSLKRICVECISVLIEFLGSWSVFVIVLKYMFSGCILFMNNGPLKGLIHSFS